MAFSPGDSISTAYFWDMGYLTQAQTHPACSHWFCHCNIPVTWDAMPALPELHLLVTALLIRRRSCLRWAVSQEQEPLPGCCVGTGLHCSLWQSGAGVTGCLPARGKVCPGQVVSMLEKNVFSRHFWMQGCLEVCNDRFSMKQRVKTSRLKKRRPPWIGLFCTALKEGEWCLSLSGDKWCLCREWGSQHWRDHLGSCCSSYRSQCKPEDSQAPQAQPAALTALVRGD